MTPNQTSRRVLLVEDDPDYCHLLQEAFVEAGFQTFQALNGEAARQLLQREDVDLVVSDFMMPEMNGLELCRVLNDPTQSANVKTVLYSANTDVLFKRKARELGALDYLTKSEDPASMVEQICHLAGWIDNGGTTEGLFSQAAESTLRAARQAERIEPILETLLDLVRVAGAVEGLPSGAKIALDSAQRSGAAIRRILAESKTATTGPRAPKPQQ